MLYCRKKFFTFQEKTGHNRCSISYKAQEVRDVVNSSMLPNPCDPEVGFRFLQIISNSVFD